MSIYDLLDDAHQHQTVLNRDAQDLFDAIGGLVNQWLDNNAVQICRSEKNTAFDPKTMKPLVRIPDADQQLDGLVAESLQAGFQYTEGNVLRLEAVSLYTYKPSLNPPSVTSIERTEP